MAYSPFIFSELSTENSSADVLASGATFTGTWVDTLGFNTVTVAAKTDKAGTLYIEFSPDGTNGDSSLSFSVTANLNEVHRLTCTRRYFRARFTNTDSTIQGFFRLQSILGNHPLLTSALNSSIQSDSDTILTRSILYGETDGGHFVSVPATAEGHLEMAIHAPRLPFGSVHSEKLTPIFQSDAVYGINGGQELTNVSGSGTATVADSMFTVTTGTTIYSQGVILGRKRLRYRAGQGVVGRFAGMFTTGVADSYQVAGFGHSEDGVYFGYKNTEFGILYTNRGVRATYTLTVTTGATSASNATVTLNGVAFTVALTAASNIQRTVWELSQATYTGWDAYPSGATVVFVRKAAGTTAGAFTYGAGTTGSVASIALTKGGASETQEFIAQTDWNGDKLDGSGPSGFTIDPTKGNVYQVNIQYLGFGPIVFMIEVPKAGNNPDFTIVHTLQVTNARTTTTFGNPSFPFTMAAYSAGSTTDLTIKVGSFSGFIEGAKVLHGNRFTYFNSITTVGSTNIQALFTIMNTRYYGGRSNQSVINLLAVMGAIKHTSPVIYYLIRGGSLTGNPNFQSLASNSSSVWDAAATTVTYSTGDQLVWTGHVGDTGEIDHHFGNGEFNAEEITLQPGEWITLGAKATTGTPSYVTGSINTREDQ